MFLYSLKFVFNLYLLFSMQILGRVPQSTLSGNYTEIRFDIE